MEKRIKKEILNFFALIFGTLLVAIAFNAFTVPNNYVTGGLSGTRIVFNELFKINPT